LSRYLVTSALPYANGPIHIGHLAGAYLPADIYVRYLRLKGEDVLFICGSDEHGVPITLRARKEGITPQQVVDKYHGIIKKSFEDFGISFDIYHRTSEKIHHETAQEFFKILYDKKILIEEESEQYFDEEAKMFLADRYIIGTCPNCGNENAYGDQCERCGKSLSPRDLINPRSQLSGKPPVLKKTKHWYLPLDKMQKDWLQKWIESKSGEWKINVYGQCKSWLDQGLQPRAVTRDLDWGVKVPLPGTEGKVLYVWFDAPIGYISATKALTKDWKKYWQDKEAKLIHFIGKDNIVFHCIIFPAMLKAHGEFIIPENVPANEFLNLEGDKISTSRNYAVWLNEYLEDFPNKKDELRYVLTSIAPETKDSDFSWKDFQARVNNELADILGNFVNRTIFLTEKYFEGKVPKHGTLNEKDKEVIDVIRQSKKSISDNIERFHFRDALGDLMSLARAGNKYLADTEPWKVYETNPERVATILYIALEITAYLGILSEPFLPNTSAKILAILNLPQKFNWGDDLKGQILSSGHTLSKRKLLFEKISDETIEEMYRKLRVQTGIPLIENLMENEKKQIASQLKPEISYDDFSKMDLRIATILTAERVPQTDKLLKLTLDTGNEQRTVVSGIAKDYEPEKIIGQKILLLANLAPRKIKGIESKGMILMAENSKGELSFVSPTKDSENGSTVK
jgi:methionyl-tRNA synthetase